MTDEFKEVKRVLTKLPDVMQKKVVTGATGAAARVIRDEAKRRVPKDTGVLQKSIIAKKAKKNNQPKEGIRYLILPKTKLEIKKKVIVNGQKGKLTAKFHAFYGRFIESGTKKMKAKPYLLPAAKATQNTAVMAFQKYVHKRTEIEVRKLAG